MEKINAYVNKGDSEEIKYGDFNAETTYEGTTEQQEFVNTMNSDDKNIIKRKKKAALTSAIVTTGVNAIPVIADVFKHRKDPTPYRVNKNDLLCLGIASAFPVFQAVDTIAFSGKCQAKIDEKLKGIISFNDIRNIVNLVNLYTPAHALIKKTMDQATAKANGMQIIPIDSFTKTRAAIGLTTLVTPFVADRLTDDSKSIAARIGSILPIPFIGSIVRSVVSKSNNTKVQGVYQIANAAINVANNANRTLTPAVRATSYGNTANKMSSELDTALNLASQLLGSPRGSIGGGMYNGGNYNYNNGWQNMSF